MEFLYVLVSLVACFVIYRLFTKKTVQHTNIELNEQDEPKNENE